MSEDGVGLRERMRSLTVGELRQLAQNRSGARDSGEVDAANEELTSRFCVHDGPLFRNVRGVGDDSMPVGLRVIFYLVSCAAAWESIAFLFLLSALMGAHMRIRMLIAAILQFGVPAAWAIWVAFTIRSEHEYVRGSLLSLLSLALIIKITRALLGQQFTYWSWIVLGALAIAVCYVAFSGAVRRYYGAMSAR